MDVVVADYTDERHAGDIVSLLNAYATDPMGGGAGLDPDVQANLPSALARVPGAFSILCYVDDHPAGLANCFEGFSTFQCRTLINIHDMVVAAGHRGMGISQVLLKKVEEIARGRGCCKITLEVLEGNEVARNAYLKFGFDAYELDPATGQAMFWHKVLRAP